MFAQSKMASKRKIIARPIFSQSSPVTDWVRFLKFTNFRLGLFFQLARGGGFEAQSLNCVCFSSPPAPSNWVCFFNPAAAPSFGFVFSNSPSLPWLRSAKCSISDPCAQHQPTMVISHAACSGSNQ